MTVSDLQFYYHGSYNVFEVKSEYIFRIPDRHFRNAKGVKQIKDEMKTLQIIQDYVHIQVPEPIYFSFDTTIPFMGYKKLEGVPLSRCFFNLDKKNKERIAKEIAFFLSELHSVDLINKFPNSKYSTKDYREEWFNYFQKAKLEIFPLLEADQQRWVKLLFNEFLSKKENFKFTPKVVHGDYDLTNILYNPETGHISGIVDFEETRIYDPAADFLFYKEGEFFRDLIIKNYAYKINTGFRNRMKFLFGRTCLTYIEFGHMNDRPEMISVGLEMLRDRMERFPLG